MPLLWNTVAATSIDLERHDGFQASGGRHRRTLPRYSCQVAYPRNKVVDYPNLGKFARATHEFATYIADNAASLINYGERFRAGERISSCLAESAVNAVTSKRFAKRQQMQWTPRGAHLLLQTRTRAVDGTLRPLFERWYPDWPTTTWFILSRRRPDHP